MFTYSHTYTRRHSRSHVIVYHSWMECWMQRAIDNVLFISSSKVAAVEFLYTCALCLIHTHERMNCTMSWKKKRRRRLKRTDAVTKSTLHTVNIKVKWARLCLRGLLAAITPSHVTDVTACPSPLVCMRLCESLCLLSVCVNMYVFMYTASIYLSLSLIHFTLHIVRVYIESGKISISSLTWSFTRESSWKHLHIAVSNLFSYYSFNFKCLKQSSQQQHPHTQSSLIRWWTIQLTVQFNCVSCTPPLLYGWRVWFSHFVLLSNMTKINAVSNERLLFVLFIFTTYFSALSLSSSQLSCGGEEVSSHITDVTDWRCCHRVSSLFDGKKCSSTFVLLPLYHFVHFIVLHSLPFSSSHTIVYSYFHFVRRSIVFFLCTLSRSPPPSLLSFDRPSLNQCVYVQLQYDKGANVSEWTCIRHKWERERERERGATRSQSLLNIVSEGSYFFTAKVVSSLSLGSISLLVLHRQPLRGGNSERCEEKEEKVREHPVDVTVAVQRDGNREMVSSTR